MARKRHSEEDVLKLLREIKLQLVAGDDVASACRSGGDQRRDVLHLSMDGSPDATFLRSDSSRYLDANIYPTSPERTGAPKWEIRVCEGPDNWPASMSHYNTQAPFTLDPNRSSHFSQSCVSLPYHPCSGRAELRVLPKHGKDDPRVRHLSNRWRSMPNCWL